jgi:hypothetical protein
MRFGIDRLIAEPALRKPLRGKRVALLAHPPGKPDFHHSDCFALELPATVRP